MKLEPRHDRVLVQRDKHEEKTAGGIIIPELAKTKLNKGTIVAVGPKVLELKAGDHVVFSRYGGTEIEVEGEACVILRDEEVFGKVRE